MRHIRVSKEGVATFDLELDLKYAGSKIYLYKVRLEESLRREGSGRDAASPGGWNYGSHGFPSGSNSSMQMVSPACPGTPDWRKVKLWCRHFTDSSYLSLSNQVL